MISKVSIEKERKWIKTVKAYVLYLFCFTNTHSASVTDLLFYRRNSDKAAHIHCFVNRCFINDCDDKKMNN